MTRRLAALAAVLSLGGCATTTVTCSDLAAGACTVSSTRLLTDSAVTLTTPDNVHLDFSSKPDQAGTQAAINALAAVVTAVVPKPAAPGAPPLEPLVAPEPHAAPADPLLQPGRWYEGARGFTRYLEGVDGDTVRYRSGQGAEHRGTVTEWRRWILR